MRPEFLDVLGKVFDRAVKKKAEPHLPEKMLDIFERASRRYPSDPRMALHRAEAHSALSQDQEADDAYRTALKLAENGRGLLSPIERKEMIEKIQLHLKKLKAPEQ
jgi:hypothetical protein